MCWVVIYIREDVEKYYDGICEITEFINQTGIINNTIPVLVYKNVPCHLSYLNKRSFRLLAEAKRTDIGSELSQIIKLYLSPDIDVKIGSEIKVIQNGKEDIFDLSTKPDIYKSHQEIKLSLKDRRS